MVSLVSCCYSLPPSLFNKGVSTIFTPEQMLWDPLVLEKEQLETELRQETNLLFTVAELWTEYCVALPLTLVILCLVRMKPLLRAPDNRPLIRCCLHAGGWSITSDLLLPLEVMVSLLLLTKPGRFPGRDFD